MDDIRGDQCWGAIREGFYAGVRAAHAGVEQRRMGGHITERHAQIIRRRLSAIEAMLAQDLDFDTSQATSQYGTEGR